MFKRAADAIREILAGVSRRMQPRRRAFVFKVDYFETRELAKKAAALVGRAAIVRGGGVDKWLLFTCPCGCGQQVALNLMKSHSPRWRVDVRQDHTFSVHPSVDSTTCGAHFWIRNGQVIWSTY